LEESAQQIVTSNLENRKSRPDRLNLDKLGAIRASFFSILVIAFFPTLIRLGANLVELLYPLRPGGMFLIFFAGAFAFSWQLASSASLVVKYLRGERGNHSQHVAFGFSALPKVLLSHSILILSLFFLFPASGEGGDFPAFIRSLLLVIVSVGFFLSWAPAFVAGEFFTKPVPKSDDDDEEEDLESMKLSFLKPKFFSGMGILDLGIERSFYFCINNFALTVSLLLLGCCVKVIPAALGVFLFGHSTSYGAVATECILSSLGIGILMVALGMTFLGCLPKDARAELELLDDSVLAAPAAKAEKSRIVSKIFVCLITTIACLATYFLVQTIKVEQSFPKALIPKFEVERTPTTMTVRFELNDSVSAYRWLDAERFRLEVPKTKEEMALAEEEAKPAVNLKVAEPLEPKKGGVLEVLQNKLAEVPKEKPETPEAVFPSEISKFNLIAPREVLFYSENGELIDEKFFKPYYGKIKVTLTFEHSVKLEKNYDLESTLSPKPNEQKLVYLMIGQTAQELGTFTAPAN
jgi:hypothetical protein